MPAQYGKVWGSAEANLMDVTCPSGEKALIRRPGVTGLMAAGVLGDLDMLTGLVDQKFVKPNTSGKGKQQHRPKDADVMDILKDGSKLEAVRRVTCKVVAYMVVRPCVRLHFTEEQGVDDKGKAITVYTDIPERERELAPTSEYPEDPVVYTDQIDFEDAMFLFQFAVGGTQDLTSFRKQLGESVASVESVEDIQAAPKSLVQGRG